MIAIIGCGGGGGWAATLFAKSNIGGHHFVLVDGDKWEDRNLDRCLCTDRDIGKFKTRTLQQMLLGKARGVTMFTEYMAYESSSYLMLRETEEPLALLVGVDNHPARCLCLQLADEREALARETCVVIAGNEYTTASADAYLPAWNNSPADFRIRFPEVTTSTEGDPLRPSCTGEEAAAAAPQLALYNSLAALSAVWLLSAWTTEVKQHRDSDLYQQIVDRMPVSVNWTAGNVSVIRKGDLCKAQ